MQLIGPFPLLIAGLVLRFATSLHTLGDIFIWVGGGLLAFAMLLLLVIAVVGVSDVSQKSLTGRR